ncbi:MAG TPA: DegQ family serine endoprotease [Aestuariivirga sp.]|mgnify:CR=1 FL=1|nr:DegQ family serine endoprotease [Aestuariivirga sp.]
MRRVIALAVLLCAMSAAPVLAQVPQSQAEVTLSFAPVVKQTTPAVVNVYAKTVVQSRNSGLPGLFDDPFFRQFFGDGGSLGRPRERVANSLGSGVIVDDGGYIVTNNHVIKGATDIRVALADAREFEARLLMADPRTDLAVLKIDAGEEKLPTLALADSDQLEVGDLVLAIGNPFGVGQTVTSGIVSALARTDVGISDYQFFIQTDAAINPGNSGGALVDMRGRLVGINTAIFSRSGGSIGIGFSIPSNMVKTVVTSAETGKPIQRPWIGAELQDVTPDIAESLGFARPEGALVADLHADSPLIKAGVQRGDVIVAIDGKAVETAKQLNYRVATAQVGQQAIIEYRRKGATREVPVTLITAPETTERATTTLGGQSPMTGLVVANLSPAVADELGLDSGATGVAVTDITGPAQRFFRKGDIVEQVNGVEIDSVATLQATLDQADGRWSIAINRGGRTLSLRIR